MPVACAFCEHRNPPAAKFCNECGSPLNLLACAECGAVNARDASACHQCGATLSAVAMTQEPFPPIVPEPFPQPEPEPYPQPVPEPFPHPEPEPFPQPEPEPFPTPAPEPFPGSPSTAGGNDVQVHARGDEVRNPGRDGDVPRTSPGPPISRAPVLELAGQRLAAWKRGESWPTPRVMQSADGPIVFDAPAESPKVDASLRDVAPPRGDIRPEKRDIGGESSGNASSNGAAAAEFFIGDPTLSAVAVSENDPKSNVDDDASTGDASGMPRAPVGGRGRTVVMAAVIGLLVVATAMSQRGVPIEESRQATAATPLASSPARAPSNQVSSEPDVSSEPHGPPLTTDVASAEPLGASIPSLEGIPGSDADAGPVTTSVPSASSGSAVESPRSASPSSSGTRGKRIGKGSAERASASGSRVAATKRAATSKGTTGPFREGKSEGRASARDTRGDAAAYRANSERRASEVRDREQLADLVEPRNAATITPDEVKRMAENARTPPSRPPPGYIEPSPVRVIAPPVSICSPPVNAMGLCGGDSRAP